MSYLKLIRYSFLFFSLPALFLAKSYGQDLTLQEAITVALENNRKLKVTGLDITRAKQDVRIARSKALPTADLTGQYSHYFKRPVFFGLGETSGQDGDKLSYARIGGEEQFSAAVSITQPLYDPSIKPAVQQARLWENTNRLEHRDEETEVIAQVKQTYLGVLVLNERLKLQYESFNRNKKVLQDAKSLYAQGRALRVDTLRAYTTLKNLEPDILKLSNAITVATLQLKTLLGKEEDQDIALTDSLFIQNIEDIPAEQEVYEEAKKLRPELQILLLNEQIAEQKISAARAGKLPSVSLIGQYQILTQMNSFGLDNAYWPSVSFAGAQISVPLFNGYSNSAKVKDAKLAKQQSVIQLNDAHEELKVAVREVVTNLHETAERLQTQSTVKETAKLSYDIIQYRYEKGVASRLELTDAELALTTAQSNYLEAVYEYLSANIQLDRIVGRTGQ